MVRSVSIGIICYNEGRNLHHLLDQIAGQKLHRIKIKEIILVSDGSTDNTNDIIKSFKLEGVIIRRIISKKRQGKYFRVNQFIKLSCSEVLILCSGDILLKKNSVERLGCKIFDEGWALVTTKTIALNDSGTVLDSIIRITWDIHDLISKIKPKGTPFMAFRKMNVHLPPNIVDEEYLISEYWKKGLRITYSQNIIHFIKGPASLKELLLQVRRYHAGHRYLLNERKYKVISLDYKSCIKELLKYFFIHFKSSFPIVLFILLQLVGRFLGEMDFFFGKKEILWRISSSTKKLI